MSAALISYNQLLSDIQNASSFYLTTHRQSDGDGLGSLAAMAGALRKLGKKVTVAYADQPPERYRFLRQTNALVLDDHLDALEPVDLTLVFDTNDPRMIHPGYSRLKQSSKNLIFIDHHPELHDFPALRDPLYLDETAASVGQIVYDLILDLGIELDQSIAKAIYTSIAFDTQMFRYVRQSNKSHEIAAHLLLFGVNPEQVYASLFGHYSKNKVAFLAECLARIEYHHGDQIAFLLLQQSDLNRKGLTYDDTRDIIDTLLNVSSVQLAIVIREEKMGNYKLSLRSKNKDVSVLNVAESLGGGGHQFASGAFVEINITSLKKNLLNQFIDLLDHATGQAC